MATEMAKKEKRVEFIGVSSLVQLAGLVLLFFFPIGTLIGIVLLIVGSQMAIKWQCSHCGSTLSNKRVRICPACKSNLM